MKNKNVLKSKAIVDYEGIYKINTDGVVTSIKSGEVIQPRPQKNGYYRVDLYKNGIGVTYYVHRLVLQTFAKNPFNKPQANHINGIKSDNRLENLEWSTSSENMKHAIATGLYSTEHILRKAVWAFTSADNAVMYNSILDASKSTGLERSTIRSCLTNDRDCKGFHFEYVVREA